MRQCLPSLISVISSCTFTQAAGKQTKLIVSLWHLWQEERENSWDPDFGVGLKAEQCVGCTCCQ